MATKQAVEAPEADKPKAAPEPFPPIATGLDENGLRWEDVDVLGTVYRVRQIGVQESDDAYDASENPDKTFNPRLNQRLELVYSVVDPKVGVDEIQKWPRLKLRAFIYIMERLNTLPAADAEGNGFGPTN